MDGVSTGHCCMTSHISCGELVLQMLVQNKAILYGDLGMTTARAIVGAVGGVISMLQMVDSPDINAICICNNLCTLSCS